MELLTSGLEVTELFILPTGQGKNLDELTYNAQRDGVRLVHKNRFELDRLVGGENHQGVIAYYLLPDPLTLTELIERNDLPAQPLMVLDGIEDPHNFGAIIRSTEVLGGGGVLFRRKRAVGITPTVVKASAGAALRFPLAEVSNIDQGIRQLQEDGYWVYGLDMDGEKVLWDEQFDGKVAFVLGAEGEGLAKLTRRRCDAILQIPQAGKIGSLNVSVSAAMAMGEWLRQKRNSSNTKNEKDS